MLMKLDIKRMAAHTIWWGGAFGILLLSQTRIETLLYLFRQTWATAFINQSLLETNSLAISSVITPVRGIIFLFSLAILSYPVIQNIRKSNAIQNSQIKQTHLLESIFLFIVLCIIFTPYHLGGLAAEYSNTSLVMFTRMSTVSYHQRFLMPALANLLFFRGDLFFPIFSLTCSLLFLFTLRIWFETNQIQVSIWQLVALGTISFVYFQIRNAGYPDVLVNIFILLAFTFKLDTRAKLSLFTLSLATHEASLIIWFALAIILFDLKGFLQFLVIAGFYLFLMWSFNEGITGILSSRVLGETSNLMWVITNPGREILGILFSFKALWAIVIGAIWYLLTKKYLKEAFQIVLLLLAGGLMTFMGVDTSRLFGWAFMAVLLSWKTLQMAENNWKKIINPALILTFIIPSFDIYLIVSPYLTPGLYKLIYHSFFNL